MTPRGQWEAIITALPYNPTTGQTQSYQGDTQERGGED